MDCVHIKRRSQEKSSDDVNAIQKLNLIARLYRILAKNEGNVCFSPFGVFMLLSVADQWAKGQPSEVLAEILRFGDTKWYTETFEKYVGLIGAPFFMEFHVANGVFVNNNAEKKVEEKSDKYVDAADFTNKSEIVGKINDWLKNVSKNQIKTVDESLIDQNVSLLLVNTMYLFGEFKYMFDEKLVITQPFYLDEVNKIDIKAVKDWKLYSYEYHEELKAKIIYIPYKHFLMHLTIILPDEKNGLKDLEEKLTKINLYEVARYQKRAFCNINISLPLCFIEQINNIDEFLPEMGLQELIENESISLKHIIKFEKLDRCCEDKSDGRTDFDPGWFQPRLDVDNIAKVDFIIDHPVVFLVTARYLPLGNLLLFGRFSHPK